MGYGYTEKKNIRNYETEKVPKGTDYIKPDGARLHLLSVVNVNVYYILYRYSELRTNALFMV